MPPVALVVGGYNKAWDHEEVFISDAEIYSMVGISYGKYHGKYRGKCRD